MLLISKCTEAFTFDWLSFSAIFVSLPLGMTEKHSQVNYDIWLQCPKPGFLAMPLTCNVHRGQTYCLCWNQGWCTVQWNVMKVGEVKRKTTDSFCPENSPQNLHCQTVVLPGSDGCTSISVLCWSSALNSSGPAPALLMLQVPWTCFAAWHPEQVLSISAELRALRIGL